MKALEALRRALEALAARGMPLLLLRERRLDDPAAASEGDFDLLVPDGRLEEALEAWHEAILETRASCLVRLSKPEKRLVVLFDPEEDREIACDLWREAPVEVLQRGRCAQRFLRYSALRPHARLEGPVLRMAPWLELLVYLGHLLEKRKDLASAGVQERLRAFASRGLAAPGCPPEVLAWLERAPGDLIEGLEGRARIEDLASRAGEALAALGLLSGGPSRLERARRWWARRRRSLARRLLAGPAVAVMGPDGAGKTTAIEGLLAAGLPGGRPLVPVVFKRLYRRSVFRFLYKTVRKLRRLRRRDEPKEVVEAALAPCLLLGALLNYRLSQLFAARGRVRLFDRFFPDLLLTNRKDAEGELDLARGHGLLARLAPRPDAAVLLAADPETIRARKPEMTAENARRYGALLCAHHTRRPPRDFLVLRTDIPLERTIAILRRVVGGV